MPDRTQQRSKRALLLAAIAAGSGAANAGAPPLPEDFLEYLGSWEADDADWVVANAAEPRPVASPANKATPPTNRSTTTARGTDPATPAPGTEPKP